jgi:hypothetical protein
MKKFEYLQITDDEMDTYYPGASIDESVQTALKELGNKGWELVSALYEYDEHEHRKEFGYKRFYFKKDKK